MEFVLYVYIDPTKYLRGYLSSKEDLPSANVLKGEWLGLKALMYPVVISALFQE